LEAPPQMENCIVLAGLKGIDVQSRFFSNLLEASAFDFVSDEN